MHSIQLYKYYTFLNHMFIMLLWNSLKIIMIGLKFALKYKILSNMINKEIQLKNILIKNS